MRVLIMNHFPLEGSGSGVYTYNVAKELVGLGCMVEVIYPEHQKTTYPEFLSQVVTFKSDSPDENGEKDVPFNFPCFTSHPRSNTTFYELSEGQIERYIEVFEAATKEAIERFKPDVIHAQHLWLMPYIASKFNIPYIVTAHGTDLKGFVQDERYHPYALEGALKAARVITISKQVDEEVRKLYGVPAERLELILNGYDQTLFKPTNETLAQFLEARNIPSDYQDAVVFAGKLAEFKGVDVLLNAFAPIEKEHEGRTCLIIAGHGDQYDRLMVLKKELDLKHVYFIGHVSQKELVSLYNIGSVSVVPSRSEPFGLVAIEALACGTPVVGTNQGGLPDFITPEIGALVPVEDVKALSQALMDELNRGQSERVARGKKCAAYAEESFSWNHAIKRVRALYDDVKQEQQR